MKSQGISVKSRNLFYDQQNESKVSKFRYISNNSDFVRMNTWKIFNKVLIENQGKLEKSQGKVREFGVKTWQTP